MRKIIGIILLMILIFTLTACELESTEASKRYQKDQESATNGLNRVLNVYSTDGKLIKTYEGKFDIETGEGGKIKFDIPQDGDKYKRVIIYNALVITEEK